MSLKHYCSTICKSCLKTHFNMREYKYVRKHGKLVCSTDLYAHYKHVYGGTLSYRSFYEAVKAMLYYDKFVCDHGVEYYYYVDGEGINASPVPNDIQYVIKAIGGFNNV